MLFGFWLSRVELSTANESHTFTYLLVENRLATYELPGIELLQPQSWDDVDIIITDIIGI